MKLKLYKNNELHRIYNVVGKIKDLYFLKSVDNLEFAQTKFGNREYVNNLGSKIKLVWEEQ